MPSAESAFGRGRSWVSIFSVQCSQFIIVSCPLLQLCVLLLFLFTFRVRNRRRFSCIFSCISMIVEFLFFIGNQPLQSRFCPVPMFRSFTTWPSGGGRASVWILLSTLVFFAVACVIGFFKAGPFSIFFVNRLCISIQKLWANGLPQSFYYVCTKQNQL